MKKNLAPLMILSLMAISPLATVAANTNFVESLNQMPAIEGQVVESLYVATNGLRVRNSAEANGKALGLLSLNEKVVLVSPVLYNGGFVEIRKPVTVNPMLESERYFVSREHLSEKETDYREFTGNRFVILNVATETLRVYERECADNSCPHKMVMETEVVVGEDKNLAKEDKGKGRSILGSYRITGWAKFYQDSERHYPSWYKDGYPDVPSILDNSFMDWRKNRYMPRDERGRAQGDMRGAFGWYAAFKAPHAYGQWLHGTIGWGNDKDKYIQQTKKLASNVFSNPRSSGCTRNNNEAIAYIRHLVGIGTPVIKVYAKEALMDRSLSNYRNPYKTWDYILTKKSGQTSDRAEVESSLKLNPAEVNAYWAAKRNGAANIVDPKSPLNQILEVGTYNVDIVPTVIEYTPGEDMGKIKRSVGRKGNIYGVKSKDMATGVYYIDTGLISGYTHPKKILDVGGFEDETIPTWMDYKEVMKK